MEQNTSEWLLLRHGKLGASDAGIIMGVSPYKTKLELYNEKILDQPVAQAGNFITDKGHRLEAPARAKHELLTGKSYPAAIGIHEKYTHLMASFDGLNPEDGDHIEVKYIGKTFKINSVDDLIKTYPHYYSQMMQQSFITGKDGTLVMINDSMDIKSLLVPIDLPYIEKMIPILNGFWECVQKRVPPSISKDDVVALLKPKITLLCKYKKIKMKIDDLEKQLEEVRSELLADLGKNNYECADGKIIYIERKGNVNYKAISELKNIDLEKYRGASSFSYMIK